MRPHLLSDEVETVIFEKNIAGRAGWRRLYDEIRAAWRFPIGGRDLTLAEALDRLSHKERAMRLEAGEAIAAVLGRSAPTIALIWNTLGRDKSIEDRRRGFARPISARNRANFVEDEVVDALTRAVKSAYPRLSHRYYRLKAKWLGQESLDDWDRTAPLPGPAEPLIPWDDAKRLVLDSYHDFSATLATIGRRVFDERRIDAAARPGKRAGAFANSTVPGIGPYLMLNYLGHDRDVTVLAHELGHGIHQILAAKQGMLMADAPVTLGETAAVFGEMLTLRRLLAEEVRPWRRRLILARKIESMLNNVVRQIALAEFERRFHDARSTGEVTAVEIGQLWQAAHGESLGEAFRPAPGYEAYWASIWHFVHEPFYVYAYAFGECLATSLYAAYEAAPAGFAERYLALLSAGGTLRHRELFAPFGLDAADPDFWDQGLGIIGGFIDELEQIGCTAAPNRAPPATPPRAARAASHGRFIQQEMPALPASGQGRPLHCARHFHALTPPTLRRSDSAAKPSDRPARCRPPEFRITRRHPGLCSLLTRPLPATTLRPDEKMRPSLPGRNL